MYKGYVIDNFDEQFDFNDMENLCTDGIIDLSDSEESHRRYQEVIGK